MGLEIHIFESMNIENHSSDDRSSWAKAVDTATEVFTACLMMVLPGIGGYFVDKYLNTSVAFTIAGVIFGLFAGFVQIIKIANKSNHAKNNSSDKNLDVKNADVRNPDDKNPNNQKTNPERVDRDGVD